jgi:hypothetical protein
VEVTLSVVFLFTAGAAALSAGLTVGKFSGKLDALAERLKALEEADPPSRVEFDRHEAGIQSQARHHAETKTKVEVLMDRDLRPERKP